jgi:hypothetical protein
MLQIQIINACCVLHNFARDRQYQMDDLLLPEVDAELAAMPNDHADDADLIRSVTLSTAWNNSRVQLAQDMFTDYLEGHAEPWMLL